MKTYRVLRQCQGFKRRMWFKDQIVVLEDDETPPYHFQLIEGGTEETPKPVEKEKPIPFSKLGEIPPVIGGFGASVDPRGNLEEPVKRGRPYKSRG